MFNPNEPRVKSGPTAGEWTSFDGSSAIQKAASDKKFDNSNEKDIDEAMNSYKPTQKEVTAIKTYSNFGFSFINSELRSGDKIDMNHDELKTIPEIDSFLSNAPKANITTYRAMNFSEDGFQNFKSRISRTSVLSDRAFMSTSISKNIVSDRLTNEAVSRYGEVRRQVMITVDGKSGVYLGKFSHLPKEREVLFPRNTKFVISDISEVNNILNIHLKEQ